MNEQKIFKNILALAIVFATGMFHASAQNIHNPILPGIADAGVIKYNGKYYIGGVYTNGDFYASDDLVNWSPPVHVFSMDNKWATGTGAGDDQIHANDMFYLNGKFHLYWSVNYWGKDKHIVHIAHAESDSILGPYIEPVKDTWMDNRIDPHVFKDDDGKLYMYMVRFTDGNTIWARPMKDPRTFGGHPIYQFASLPSTWETMDNRVAEGPWVIKYRNRYYMMYNANHTATEWGNYQLGVAEADSPTSFNNGNKYPYPLLVSNRTALEEQYTDILRFGEAYSPYFYYTTTQPRDDWKKPDYDVSSWQQGQGGFASEKTEGSTTRHQGTEWNTPAIYLRKTFSVDKSRTGNLALRISHDGDTQVFLNGRMIYTKKGADHIVYNLTDKDKSALTNGTNIIAIESKKGRKNYINASLFDMKDDTADDILFSPGQPNILRGPNGFEWWLIYMANKNKERRGQYINRIYFHNKTMHADGITSDKTKGYFPAPAKPTYGDTFDNADSYKDNQVILSGEWNVRNGEYVSSGNASQSLLTDKLAATSYLFESGIKTETKAGIIAWSKDKDNRIKIGLNARDKCWYIEKIENKVTDIQTYPLPDDFKYGVYHKITVERNVNHFSIKIDDIPAPGLTNLETSITEKGVPGLFSESSATSFDGVLYTIGWDEFDNHITSWGNSLSGEKMQGKYSVSKDGMSTSDTKFQAFKGDLLSNYEFTVQITNESDGGITGAYPVYIDKDNYVQAVFDYNTKSLIVTKVINGNRISSDNYKPENLKTHYADIKYTDFIEKGYTFNSPTWIDGIHLNRMAEYDKNLFVDNMFDKISVEYKSNNKWIPLPLADIKPADNPMYNQAFFNPVKTEALRFINRNAEDLNSYLYKIKVKELFKNSYNLRCIKLKDTLLILVDGKHLCKLNIDNRPAQVGLYSEDSTSCFNGIMRYHIP